MNEQTCISIGQTESWKNQTPVAKGATPTARFDGKGSPSKVAAQTQRSSMTPPPAVLGACWIPLSKGLFALVDDDVASLVNQKFWTAYTNRKKTRRYALFREHPSKKTIFLHNWIMQVPEGKVVDHINGDGLDCRKINMRICLPAENKRNNGKWSSKTSSRFKGVHYAPRYRLKWAAAINFNRKTVHIGRFGTETEAAKAYDVAARNQFGAFARPNFPCV